MSDKSDSPTPRDLEFLEILDRVDGEVKTYRFDNPSQTTIRAVCSSFNLDYFQVVRSINDFPENVAGVSLWSAPHQKEKS